VRYRPPPPCPPETAARCRHALPVPARHDRQEYGASTDLTDLTDSNGEFDPVSPRRVRFFCSYGNSREHQSVPSFAGQPLFGPCRFPYHLDIYRLDAWYGSQAGSYILLDHVHCRAAHHGVGQDDRHLTTFTVDSYNEPHIDQRDR